MSESLFTFQNTAADAIRTLAAQTVVSTLGTPAQLYVSTAHIDSNGLAVLHTDPWELVPAPPGARLILPVVGLLTHGHGSAPYHQPDWFVIGWGSDPSAAASIYLPPVDITINDTQDVEYAFNVAGGVTDGVEAMASLWGARGQRLAMMVGSSLVGTGGAGGSLTVTIYYVLA